MTLSGKRRGGFITTGRGKGEKKGKKYNFLSFFEGR